ncbi:MAG: helicase HerA-like domain-containing protein, partial [Pseudomonadota bacterium]
EKTGPVALLESRTAEEARLIIAKRLQKELAGKSSDPSATDPNRVFGPNFKEEFGGLSTRRLLEHAQNWLRGNVKRQVTPVADTKPTGTGSTAESGGGSAGLISTLAAALGFGGDKDAGVLKPAPAAIAKATGAGAGNLVLPTPPDVVHPTGGPTAPPLPVPSVPPAPPTALVPASASSEPATPEGDAHNALAETTASGINYREHWERFTSAFEAELTDDDGALLDAIAAGLTLAAVECGDEVEADITIADLDHDLPALDVDITHSTGHTFEARVFLCNRPTQGGGFKRQLEKVIPNMAGRTCFLIRASEFPPSKKNQAAQVFRKYREEGGRHMMIAIPEWERIMTAREFHLHHRDDPGFAEWFADAKLVSGLTPIAQMLRLDLLGKKLPPLIAPTQNAGGRSLRDVAASPSLRVVGGSEAATAEPTPLPGAPLAWDDALPDAVDAPTQTVFDDVLAPSEPEPGSIDVGTYRNQGEPIHIPQPIMKRHCAVLGGSGSGKTTLALSIIEQLLLEGIPAILIDRKGDLCSYANPDVWGEISGDDTERVQARTQLQEAADVAVYTPGRSAGRPISITLLPSGTAELPDEELELLARHSAEALGDMLHLKKSATNQKQMGTLQVALKLLGARSNHEIMLADLINLLETDDPELDERMQRMDPSGKLRRDLVAQLDSLRYRNAALFEAGGENMRMESLLGLGPYAKTDKTRLSIIYTGFLGDNENILFWVSQFLSEALRFCQRNPNDALQAVVMFDEADLYIPANAKPATAEPLQSLLKRARSAGLGIMLATQSPGDLDYKSRDQITSWFIGRVREDTALKKLKAAFQSESGLDPVEVLPGQTVGEFHLVQERLVRPMRAHRSLIQAEQVPFGRIEDLAAETRGQDDVQLALFRG